MQRTVNSRIVLCICKMHCAFEISSRYHNLNICLSNILIFAVQQSIIAAPNLTSRESRKDWETAFSSIIVTPTLTVCFPLIFGSLKWFYISFSVKYINFANKATHDVMNT